MQKLDAHAVQQAIQLLLLVMAIFDR